MFLPDSDFKETIPKLTKAAEAEFVPRAVSGAIIFVLFVLLI